MLYRLAMFLSRTVPALRVWRLRFLAGASPQPETSISPHSGKDVGRSRTAANATGMTIGIVPVGPVDAQVVKHLTNAVRDVFRQPVRVDGPLDEPDYAYDARRGQFLASAVLDRINESRLPDEERVLGVADVDLFVPELNFVFGVADPVERVAVISLARLRPEFYGHRPDRALFLDRAVKEAVHELGHTYGLQHCPDPECIMHFSNSILDTDRKQIAFCPRCRVGGGPRKGHGGRP